MADTTTTQQKNPLAQAFLQQQEAGSRAHQGAPDTPVDAKTLAQILQQKNEGDFYPEKNQSSLKEDQEKRERALARARDLAAEEEQHQVILNQATLKETREIEALQKDIAAMQVQKNVPVSQRRKIVDARVVDPGTRKYIFSPLIEEAFRYIKKFSQQPYQIAQERSALRSGGAVVNRGITREQQAKINNLDSNRMSQGA